MILEWIMATYGADIVNAILKMSIEFVGFMVYSLSGTLIRENLFEKKANWKRATMFAFLSAVVLFSFGNKLGGMFSDPRMLFGLSVFFGLSFSLFSDSLKSGNLLKGILGMLKSTKDSAIDLAVSSIEESEKKKELTETEVIEAEVRKRIEEKHRKDIEHENNMTMEEKIKKRVEEELKKELEG